MRIAIFVDAFPTISETFILNQITGLIDRGHEVDIFARWGDREAALHADIERYRLLERTYYFSRPGPLWRRIGAFAAQLARTPRWLLPRGLLAAMRAGFSSGRAHSLTRLTLLTIASRELENGPYDVVHCQYGTLGRLLLPAVRRGLIGGRLVTSFRGHDITQQDKFDHAYYGELFRHGDLFLPVSRSLAERLLAIGCPPDRVRVLHSGIDCSRFTYEPRVRLEGQPTRIITVARLVEMKGVRYAVEAVAALSRTGRDVCYDIVGDGPLRDEIDGLIEQYGIADRVRRHGWLGHQNLEPLLRSAHILLTPSVTAGNGEMEGIPNVIKEAMAMGLPVVATRHSGIPELVTDGVTGLLAPERDPEALARHLAHLHDHPERWADMGSAGRAFVEAHFDRDQLNDRLVALYGDDHRAAARGLHPSARPG